jgi:hypothetical protein
MSKPFLVHRFEWILACLGLIFLLVLRISFPSLEAPHYGQLFADAKDVYSVQRLVEEQCSADIHGLCSPCTKTSLIDPPFLSLLEPIEDDSSPNNQCSLSLISPTTPIDMKKDEVLKLLVRHLLEQSYRFVRVYFYTVFYEGPHGQVADEEGIHNVNMAAWSSLVDFVTKPQAKPGVLLITVKQEDPSSSSSSSDKKDNYTTPPKSAFRLVPGDFTEDEVRETIQKVVSYYETPPISHTDLDGSSDDDDDEYLYNVPVMLDYRLAFHKGEYEDFFVGVFLPSIIGSLRKIDHTKKLNPSPMLHVLPQHVVKEGRLDQCLWHHYHASTLLTKNCPKAMNEASNRLPDLSYERVHGNHKGKIMNAEWFFWLSFLIVAGTVYRLHSSRVLVSKHVELYKYQHVSKYPVFGRPIFDDYEREETAEQLDGMVNRYHDRNLAVRLSRHTKLLYNVRMCFLVHFAISAGLLVYCWRRSNTFLDSSVLLLSALLFTYLIPTADEQRPILDPGFCELPLLKGVDSHETAVFIKRQQDTEQP